MPILTGPESATLAAFDTQLDSVFADGIPGVVNAIPGYSGFTSGQKTKVRNVFNAVVGAMLLGGAAPAGYTGSVVAGTATLTFTNGILVSVA